MTITSSASAIELAVAARQASECARVGNALHVAGHSVGWLPRVRFRLVALACLVLAAAMFSLSAPAAAAPEPLMGRGPRNRGVAFRLSQARAGGPGGAAAAGRRGTARRAPADLRPVWSGSGGRRQYARGARRRRPAPARGNHSGREPGARHVTALALRRGVARRRRRQGEYVRQGGAGALGRQRRALSHLLGRDVDRRHGAKPRPTGRVAAGAAGRAVARRAAGQCLPSRRGAVPALHVVCGAEAAPERARSEPRSLSACRSCRQHARDGEGADGGIGRL